MGDTARDIAVGLAAGLLSGLVVMAGTVLWQGHIDDARANRDNEIAAQQEASAERLENLRFVRDRSSLDTLQRPFASLDLEGQNLSGLALRGADLFEANLRSADLEHTDISEETTGTPTNLLRADLQDAHLREANMIRAYARGANFTNVDLTDALLCGVDFNHAVLRGAKFNNANLSGHAESSLKRTQDYTKNYYGYNFIYAGSSADLSNADVAGADFSGVNLYGVNLTNIYYDASTIWPDRFQPPPSRPTP